MNKLSIKKQVQSGFTLIELIVVIVILGILAATALPKFASLGGDARLASLQAARGAMSSTVAMAHAKYLVDTAVQVSGSTVVEGKTITFAVTPATPVTGYPLATKDLVEAAGLETDYTYIAPGSAATATSPATSATQVAVVPNSIAGTAAGLICFVRYTEATNANTPPTVIVTGSSTACQ